MVEEAIYGWHGAPSLCNFALGSRPCFQGPAPEVTAKYWDLFQFVTTCGLRTGGPVRRTHVAGDAFARGSAALRLIVRPTPSSAIAGVRPAPPESRWVSISDAVPLPCRRRVTRGVEPSLGTSHSGDARDVDDGAAIA